MSDEPDQKKIVILADARQRQRTTAQAARAGAKAGSQPGGKNKGPRGRAPGAYGQPPKAPKPRLWSYVQLLLVFGLVAYLMRLCRMG